MEGAAAPTVIPAYAGIRRWLADNTILRQYRSGFPLTRE